MRHMKWFFALILAGFLLIPHSSEAANVKIHPYECKTCHTAGIFQAGLGNPLANNVCLQCHAPGKGDTAAHFPPEAGSYPFPLDGLVEGVFAVGDASNNYGNGNGGVGDKQTSHNWGAPISNPEAGAAAPSKLTRDGAAFYSRYGSTGSTVTRMAPTRG